MRSIFISMLLYSAISAVEIRLATQHDLQSLIDLDTQVTHDYFVPLIRTELSHVTFWHVQGESFFEDDLKNRSLPKR